MRAGEQVRDYVLEQRIGAGGVGEVWRARHIRLNKPVAIKLILPHLCEDENIYSRFVQEAMATASLEHPQIINVHDFFSIGGDSFIVMAYIEGGSLQDRIRKCRRLSVAETLHIARGILDALDFAHRKGIVHRDVKPSNILLSADLHAYLVDFGIALVLGKTRITRFGASIGTPDYMSPEQIRGQQVDHRTDVYSFGCVLYEMLTGRSPFRGSDDDSEFAVMERHMNEAPAPVSSSNPEVSADLQAVIMRALAKDRDQRFTGCADMAQALMSAATIDGGAKPVGNATRALTVAVGVLALTTIISAAGWITTYWAKEGSNVSGLAEEVKPLNDQLAANGETSRATIDKLQAELQATEAARKKAEADVLRLQKATAAGGGSDNVGLARLEKELQEVTKARDRAEGTVRDLKERLAASKPTDNAVVAKLRDELDDARTAHEGTIKELRQLKNQLAAMERQKAKAGP